MLTLTIRKQYITISNPQQFIKGTVGAKCKVIFDKLWTDYNRTVVFKPSGKFRGRPIAIYVPDMITELTIPWEVLDKVGSFKIGAYGTTDELTTPTLWCESIIVVDGTDTTGKAPQEPAPNVYNQLIDIANEAVSVAQSVRDDADAGKFNGEKGEKGDKGDPGSGGGESVDLSNYYTKDECDNTFAQFDNRLQEAINYSIRIEFQLNGLAAEIGDIETLLGGI